MECPICLEPIGPSSILGRIHGCLHTYHRDCVVHWSTQSNSCPTCRKSFHGIDIVANDAPNRVIQTIAIKDKLLGTDAINQIPPEYIIPARTYATLQQHQQEPSEDPDPVQAGVCLICSSAQYSMRGNRMVSCISCGGNFHTTCLGHSGEPSWFCPVCDCHQEFPVALSRARTPRVSRISLSVREQTSAPRRTSPGSRRSPNSARNGRLLLLETPESGSVPTVLDSDDWDAGSSDRVSEPRYMGGTRGRNAVWNGGVLLRRQARELQNLTPEERSSWNILESARRGNLTDVSDTVEQESSTRRRRRKRPAGNTEGNLKNESPNSGMEVGHSPVLGSSAASEIPFNQTNLTGSQVHQETSSRAGPSRIASLMNQIKSRHVASPANSFASSENSPSQIPENHNYTTSWSLNNRSSDLNDSFSSEPQIIKKEPCTISGVSPANNILPQEIPATETQTNTSSGDTAWTPRPLTLDEKSMVQTHVRNNLRPLYRGDRPDTRRIHTEDEYIRINKGISRKVYSHISSLCTVKGPEVYGEFFQGRNDHLKQLVDSFVEGWTRDVLRV